MSHADVRAWLEPRLAEVPNSLAKCIREAVAAGSGEGGGGHSTEPKGVGSSGCAPPSSPLPDALRAIASRLLCDAWSLPSNSEKAMLLLTADALITYACEAVAEGSPDCLAELR